MNIRILGSGGCISLPKVLCNCKVCTEARSKGGRYKRYGCSIYIDEIKTLFDTPEDIVHSLNDTNIKSINNVFYSHRDPDHTMGVRVLESLRKNWLNISPELENLEPVNIYALPDVMSDLNKLSSAYGSYLDYYEKEKNIIKRISVDEVNISGYNIKLVPIVSNIISTMFVITFNGYKVIYAPCDIKPLNTNYLDGADLLIIGSVIPTRNIKNNFYISDDNPLLNNLYLLDDIVNIKKEYHIKNVIITHLEEDWGLGYDDYLNLEKELDGIRFAYDGMTINIGGE